MPSVALTKEIRISSLKNKHFELRPNGLVVHGQPSFEDWEEAGKVLKHMEKTVQWWLGDWLNYGEMKWGEKYSQALDRYDYEYGTLRNVAWVANRIESSRRHDNLSFAHHQIVAPLEPDDQDCWLHKAEEKGWSKRDLLRAIKDACMKTEIVIQREDTRLIFLKKWLNCFFEHYSFKEDFEMRIEYGNCKGCLQLSCCKMLKDAVKECLALRGKICKTSE